jgi:uncharacterized protein YllA (UPF0747 family)
LNLRTLPGFSPLFLDYVDGTLPAISFFAGRPVAGSLLACAKRAPDNAGDRGEIVRLLASQAESVEAGFQSRKNLELLREPGAVCILAGIAPDLFGGPLSGWLKALTAALLSSWLADRGIPAIPIVWLHPKIPATNPQAGFLGAQGPEKIVLPPAVIPETGNAGSLEEQLLRALPMGVHSEMFRLLLAAYQPGRDMTLAWGRFMAKVFEPFGIVWIDAGDTALASEIASRWSPEERNQAASLRRDAAAGLRSSGYGAPDDREDLAHAFWPCHRILPVAAIITDEFEVSARACDEAMLRGMRMAVPLLWPRISATLIDGRSRKILNRYGLGLRDLFQDPAILVEALAGTEASVDATLENLHRGMSEKFEQVAALVPAEDKMQGRIRNARRRMTYQVHKLRALHWNGRKMRRLLMEQRFPRLCNALAPWKGMQEREFAGFDLLERLFSGSLVPLVDRLSPWQLAHQEIDVSK